MMSPTTVGAYITTITYITIIHNASHWLGIQKGTYISTTGLHVDAGQSFTFRGS